MSSLRNWANGSGKREGGRGYTKKGGKVTYLKKHLTTCLSSRAVCCSTSCATILLRTVPTA